MPTRKTIGVRRFKNQATRILSEVRENESEYVVTRRGEPVAVLSPYRKDSNADPSTRLSQALRRLKRTARQVAVEAGRETAASIVSRQRR